MTEEKKYDCPRCGNNLVHIRMWNPDVFGTDDEKNPWDGWVCNNPNCAGWFCYECRDHHPYGTMCSLALSNDHSYWRDPHWEHSEEKLAKSIPVPQPLRIYIAGPYTPPKGCSSHDAPRIAQQNLDRAIEAANKLIDKGHYVFVPHLSHYVHIHYSSKTDRAGWWYDEDNTFLDHWATALLYLRPSNGADMELDRATKLGIHIFRSVDEVPIMAKCFRIKWSE